MCASVLYRLRWNKYSIVTWDASDGIRTAFMTTGDGREHKRMLGSGMRDKRGTGEANVWQSTFG